MKKFLLTCAAAVVAMSQSFAAQTSFGYCENEIIDCLGNYMAGQYSGAAIMIPGGVLAGYGDASLKAVEIGYGKMTNTKVSVFLTYALDEEPFYIQEANIEPMKFNTVTLDTPYTLTDKSLYVGYIARTTSNSDRPFAMDGTDVTNPNGAFVAYSSKNNLSTKQWDVQEGYGNLCIRGIIDTPVNMNNFLWATSVNMPGMTGVGKEFSAELNVWNLGLKPVTSVEASVKVGDSAPEVMKIDVPAIASGAQSVITLSGLKTTEVNEDTPVSISITGVNGEINAMSTYSLDKIIASLSDYYTRTVVIEEGTGTACPWCVRGYTGMEYMREDYNDKGYIGIAAHVYNDNDPMYCAKYNVAAKVIFKNPVSGTVGFPCAVVNRQELFDPSIEDCRKVYDKYHNTYCFQKVDFTARYTNPHYEEVEVMCDLTSLTDLDSHKLGLAVVTTEDEVGPYDQDNGYSGGNQGPMEGYEKLPPKVSLIFNDVARSIVSWNGNTNALPDKIEAGVPAKAESLYISTEKINKLRNSYLTVLLIDTENGEIVNATRIPMPEPVIENVDPASAKIVPSDNPDAEFYTLDGLRVTDEYLAPGLYIKRRNGKSVKVVVK